MHWSLAEYVEHRPLAARLLDVALRRRGDVLRGMGEEGARLMWWKVGLGMVLAFAVITAVFVWLVPKEWKKEK